MVEKYSILFLHYNQFKLKKNGFKQKKNCYYVSKCSLLLFIYLFFKNKNHCSFVVRQTYVTLQVVDDYGIIQANYFKYFSLIKTCSTSSQKKS